MLETESQGHGQVHADGVIVETIGRQAPEGVGDLRVAGAVNKGAAAVERGAEAHGLILGYQAKVRLKGLLFPRQGQLVEAQVFPGQHQARADGRGRPRGQLPSWAYSARVGGVTGTRRLPSSVGMPRMPRRLRSASMTLPKASVRSPWNSWYCPSIWAKTSGPGGSTEFHIDFGLLPELVQEAEHFLIGVKPAIRRVQVPIGDFDIEQQVVDLSFELSPLLIEAEASDQYTFHGLAGDRGQVALLGIKRVGYLGRHGDAGDRARCGSQAD